MLRVADVDVRATEGVEVRIVVDVEVRVVAEAVERVVADALERVADEDDVERAGIADAVARAGTCVEPKVRDAVADEAERVGIFVARAADAPRDISAERDGEFTTAVRGRSRALAILALRVAKERSGCAAA